MSFVRNVYSKKLLGAIDELRPAFCDLGQGLDKLARKRAEIAPLFVRAYQIWRRETKRPFIAFVHELDPTMPVNDRTAYRRHRSYRAAQYLLQVAAQPEKVTRPQGVSPLALLAVTIKSFLPLVGSEKDQRLALEMLMNSSRWREVDIRRLTAKIRRVKPISVPNLPRLVKTAKSTKDVVVAFERDRMAS